MVEGGDLPDGHAYAVGEEEARLVVRERVGCVYLCEQVGLVWTRASPPADLVLCILADDAGGALERVVDERGGGPHARVAIGRIAFVVLLVLLGEVRDGQTVDVDGGRGRGWQRASVCGAVCGADGERDALLRTWFEVGVLGEMVGRLGGVVQMLDGHDAGGRVTWVGVGPVTVAKGVSGDDGCADEVARVETWAARVRCGITVVAKLVFGAWRAGALLEERRVLVDVRGEALDGCGGGTASRLELLRERLDGAVANVTTIGGGRAAMALRAFFQVEARVEARVVLEEQRRGCRHGVGARTGTSRHVHRAPVTSRAG